MEKVFDHTHHVKLWEWLAANPTKHKNDWPEWKINGGNVNNADCLCFACECREESTACFTECPLIWPKEHSWRVCGALFYAWKEADNPASRNALALQIAHLPVREGVITK